MSRIIKDYYDKLNISEALVEKKLIVFGRNPDISAEFEKWISDKVYVDEVNVEGYTASKIANISRFLKGEGAFLLLIELRENPEKAKKRIKAGFVIR